MNNTGMYQLILRCADADVVTKTVGKPFCAQKVKVKINDQLVSAVVEKCHFISKFSFDCYFAILTFGWLSLINCLDNANFGT